MTREFYLGGDVGFAIGHHRPRRGDSARPDLENDYINLYWTCGECNQNKGHTWPTAAETARGYDGDGNAIAYASGTLDYDEESRLGSLTISGGTSPGYRAGYRGDGLRAWRVSSSGTVTYFVYDDASGTLQYEVEGSAGAYTIRNAYGHGAAGLAQRFQPTVSNRVTSFAYDPSGNTVSRSISSGTSTLPSGYPTEVALYDGYGKPVADVSCSVAYSTTTGPTSYGAGYSVGFGGHSENAAFFASGVTTPRTTPNSLRVTCAIEACSSAPTATTTPSTQGGSTGTRRATTGTSTSMTMSRGILSWTPTPAGLMQYSSTVLIGDPMTILGNT